ncbi:hypothetical protein C8R44DRAFT_751286 [Mycena epipterygia]|nr:hypothetical protein C8R44DRAFT_751286 [Mycena epipterygia]
MPVPFATISTTPLCPHLPPLPLRALLRTRAVAPGFVHSVSNGAPPCIIHAPAVSSAAPSGIAHGVLQGLVHAPAASNTAPPPPGIAHAPDTSNGVGRARNPRPPPVPRNPAAEASVMIRAVLPTHDLREAFERAHRYDQHYVACAFKMEA